MQDAQWQRWEQEYGLQATSREYIERERAAPVGAEGGMFFYQIKKGATPPSVTALKTYILPATDGICLVANDLAWHCESLAVALKDALDIYEAAVDDFVTEAQWVETRLLKNEPSAEISNRIYSALAQIVILQRGLYSAQRVAEAEEVGAKVTSRLDAAENEVQALQDLFESALDAVQSQVTDQQNDDMRKIAAWAAIIAVPTMIAGIYGMNFDTMPELKWGIGYPLIIGIMIVLSVAMWRNFQRRGWL